MPFGFLAPIAAAIGGSGVVSTIAKAAIPSLVGGLFNRGSQTAGGIDYKKLVSDALGAGFNPKTALQAGGGQAYQQMPSMSSRDFMVNALTDGVQAGLDYDPLAKKKRELEIEILEAEVASYGRPVGVPTGGAGGYTSGQGYTSGTPSMRNSSRTVPDEYRPDINITGADPENPRELEADAWQAAIDGDVWLQAQRVINKNSMSKPDYDDWNSWASERVRDRLTGAQNYPKPLTRWDQKHEARKERALEQVIDVAIPIMPMLREIKPYFPRTITPYSQRDFPQSPQVGDRHWNDDDEEFYYGQNEALDGIGWHPVQY